MRYVRVGMMTDDELAVAKRLLKDALERRQHAKPGTPAWYRAAEDIKRGWRKVAHLTKGESNG